MFALFQRTAAAHRLAPPLSRLIRSSALFAAPARLLPQSLIAVQRHHLLRTLASSAVERDSSSADERIREAKRVREGAERVLDEAKREFDEAKALLKALEAAKASVVAIERAHDDVARIDKRLTAALEAHAAAINAEAAVVKGAGAVGGAQLVPFALKADVKARLSRPLSEWRAGETFDVSGIRSAVGAPWHDVLFLRAEGLAVLREWESVTPHLVVHGSPGIGKSTLLQLAAMRALVNGDPLLLHVRGQNTLIELVDDATLRVEQLTSVSQMGHNGLPGLAETVVCYDSPAGYQVTFGLAPDNKRTFIVHSPSGNLNNTRKARVRSRLLTPPPFNELVALAALAGIEESEVQWRVDRFGPIIRYLFDPVEAEKWVKAGIEAMVPGGVDGLVDFFKAPRDVHRITLMLPEPDGIGIMHTFTSDYIRDEVVRRVARQHAADLLRLANTVDLHGSLRGQVFESRMLDTLGRAGAEIKLKTSAGDDKVLKIAGDGVALRTVDNKLALPAGESTLRSNVLYRPPRSNNASWDALLVVEADNAAYLLQMTVAEEHPVKRHGLAAGSALLRAHGFRGEVRLVFLVPPAAFEQFRVPQLIVNVDGAPAATGEQQWPQDKWQVVAVNSVTFWPAPKND